MSATTSPTRPAAGGGSRFWPALALALFALCAAYSVAVHFAAPVVPEMREMRDSTY